MASTARAAPTASGARVRASASMATPPAPAAPASPAPPPAASASSAPAAAQPRRQGVQYGGEGVRGESASGTGVVGQTTSGVTSKAVYGTPGEWLRRARRVDADERLRRHRHHHGRKPSPRGVYGYSGTQGYGVYGANTNGVGVYGQAVFGVQLGPPSASSAPAVQRRRPRCHERHGGGGGVYGGSATAYGVIGNTTAAGYFGADGDYEHARGRRPRATSTNPSAFAAYFSGATVVQGDFTVFGGAKSAAVPHPRCPVPLVPLRIAIIEWTYVDRVAYIVDRLVGRGSGSSRLMS